MSVAKKLGVVFAAVHIIVFVLFVAYLFTSGEGQDRLLWALWLPLDFPVSLFVTMGFDHISPSSQFGVLVRTWLPYIVHGLLGPIWWFFIPMILANIFNRLLSKSSGHRRYD